MRKRARNNKLFCDALLFYYSMVAMSIMSPSTTLYSISKSARFATKVQDEICSFRNLTFMQFKINSLHLTFLRMRTPRSKYLDQASHFSLIPPPANSPSRQPRPGKSYSFYYASVHSSSHLNSVLKAIVCVPSSSIATWEVALLSAKPRFPPDSKV